MAAPERGHSPADAPAADVSRLHVLMLSGGGVPAQNFRSHLIHLQRFLALVEQAGVPRERISVLAADGSDAGADLAVLDEEPEEGLWLLDRTPLQDLLAPTLSFENSQLPGVSIEPATRGQLAAWFRKARKRLRPGDTLLVFVTDHGHNAGTDPWKSEITLWGPRQALDVRQLETLMGTLDPRVRVVTLMSQCFSGGFAQLYTARTRKGLPAGNTCGFFSSTADRPAYGCFPENVGQDAVGHAFTFFESLRRGSDFSTAHRETLLHDDSPDVPLRTSDVFLFDTLEAQAQRTGQPLEATVDALLAKAWKNKARWEPEIRLLDALGRAYGLFSPRSLAELEAPGKQLDTVLEQLDKHGRLWEDALSDITNGNLADFLQRSPQWRGKLEPHAIQRLEQEARRGLARALLDELGPFTEAKAERWARLQRVAERLDTINEVAYRMEVRLAALLRMRALLARVAGQVLLETQGSAEHKQALAALTDCERFSLPLGGKPEDRSTPSLPPFEDDLARAEAVFPAWLGIQFGGVPAALAKRLSLPEGASMIQRVFPQSPAAKAGLRAGDVVLGPPDEPFADNNQVRTWTMLSATGTPLPFLVLREGKKMTAPLTLTPYPSELPKLPGRPKEGEAAPSLGALEAYRGRAPEDVAGKAGYMLFYWATWCGPCKASVPEVMQFAQARQLTVIAVTDEDRETLDAFFAKHKAPFPTNVAMDPSRTTFVTYGISATPTFVLVDGSGRITSYVRGYDSAAGLPFPGWRRP